MRILIVSNYFPPEIGSAPHLIFEFGETLVQSGHQVDVVTGMPRYNLPGLPAVYRRRLVHRERTAGMNVFRINAPNFYGTSLKSRGLVQLLAPPVLALRALALKRPDVVYTVTPPLLLGITARLVAARYRAPLVVNVQDLFPQTMIDLGLLKNRSLIRTFQAMEHAVYRSASAITVMSDGNGPHVVRRGARAENVSTVPNWVDVQQIRPGEKNNDFCALHRLGEHFIVLFAGTMGASQGLETVVEAARLLADRSRILFVLVGDGVERERLERQAAGLTNIRFLPMQQPDVYPDVLATADACLVTLRADVRTPTVPSKIGTIMAAARPILASLPHGDAPKMIDEAQCGIIVPAGDAALLAEAVRALQSDPAAAAAMGNRGRIYAEARLSREACVRLNEGILKRVVETHR